MRYLIIAVNVVFAALLAVPLTKSLGFFFEAQLSEWFSNNWTPYSDEYGFGVSFFGSLYLTIVTIPIVMFGGWIVAYQITNEKRAYLKSLFMSIMQLWSSLPSVIIGVWGISQLIPLFRMLFDTPGYSLLLAGICVGLYLVPISTLLYISSYGEYRKERYALERSLDLGFFDRSQMFFKASMKQVQHIFNYSFCRIFGETMIILMVSGNTPELPTSLLEPVRTMTATFALEAPYAVDFHEQALYGVAGVCMLTVLLVLLSGKIYEKS